MASYRHDKTADPTQIPYPILYPTCMHVSVRVRVRVCSYLEVVGAAFEDGLDVHFRVLLCQLVQLPQALHATPRHARWVIISLLTYTCSIRKYMYVRTTCIHEVVKWCTNLFSGAGGIYPIQSIRQSRYDIS